MPHKFELGHPADEAIAPMGETNNPIPEIAKTIMIGLVAVGSTGLALAVHVWENRISSKLRK